MAFLKLVIFAVFFTVTTSASPVEPHTHTGCGQVLTDISGGISYKPYESYASNEQCVWVIRAPGAVQYTINFYNLLPYKNYVQVATIGLNQELAQLKSIESDQEFTTDGNVLIVTFTTPATPNNNNEKGFAMWYTAVVNGSSEVSPNSRDTIIGSPESSLFRHSQSQLEYSNNELSTFLFAPNFLYEAHRHTRLQYTQLGWAGVTCDDSISLYELAATTTWKPLGLICGADKDMLISSKNMLLMVFKTDADGVASGFTLDYTYEA